MFLSRYLRYCETEFAECIVIARALIRLIKLFPRHVGILTHSFESLSWLCGLPGDNCKRTALKEGLIETCLSVFRNFNNKMPLISSILHCLVHLLHRIDSFYEQNSQLTAESNHGRPASKPESIPKPDPLTGIATAVRSKAAPKMLLVKKLESKAESVHVPSPLCPWAIPFCDHYDIIIAAIRANRLDESIQRYGCLLLHSYIPPVFSSSFSPSLLVSLVIDAADSHRTSISVQEAVCLALERMSHRVDLKVHLQQPLVIKAMVDAMLAHPDCSDIQRWASVVLDRLSGTTNSTHLRTPNKAVQDLCARNGVVQALLAALRSHPDNMDVQSNIFAALGTLAVDNPMLKEILLKVDVLNIAKKAEQKFKNGVIYHRIHYLVERLSTNQSDSSMLASVFAKKTLANMRQRKENVNKEADETTVNRQLDQLRAVKTSHVNKYSLAKPSWM
eukprot:GILK01013028.1.p1 GENE.GILK01013028.1~~GILK01013028.1.p1  ORF type:complete len:447 (-),score=77.29 GILK01013028.1:207-1547(-)